MKKYKNIFLDNRLNRLKLLLESDVLNLGVIRREINELATYKDIMQYDYYKDLINPSRHGVKIPSVIPIPSCTFTFKKTAVMKPYNTGELFIKYNPFFLGHDIYGTFKQSPIVTTRYNYLDVPLTSMWTYMESDVVSDMQFPVSSSFYPYNLDQVIPSNIYSAYRLVSASISLQYQGPLEDAVGYIGGSPVFFEDQSLGGRYYSRNEPNVPYPPPPGTSTYTLSTKKGLIFTEKYLRQQVLYKETSCLNKLTFNYFPPDNSFLEFVQMIKPEEIYTTNMITSDRSSNPNWQISKKYYKSGFFWVLFAKRFPYTRCVRVEVESNFECLPAAEFMNYAPISVYPYSLNAKDMNEIISVAKDHCANIIRRC